jgi:hypothetical protein
MPIHDWTRVSPNDYHDMHFAWLAAIRTSLNSGILPPGYFAMTEHTARPIVPDVLTMNLAAGARSMPNGGPATLPTATYTATAQDKRRPWPGRRRVVIQHAENRRLVAVIELVSPSNKARQREFADLIDKSIQLLRQDVNLLLIDPFPPTARDPHGIHAVLWRRLTGGRYEPPPGKPLTLAAYVARGNDTITTFVEPLAVGDALPEMPLYLNPNEYVKVPLEATYQAAWAGFAPDLRPLLEGDSPA